VFGTHWLQTFLTYMLCRYDSMALKSLDIFSVHGFPVGLVQCESNLLGITMANGASVGSGGWTNIVDKYQKAKKYCEQPFEVQSQNGSKRFIPIKGEWIGERLNGARPRSVTREHGGTAGTHTRAPSTAPSVTAFADAGAASSTPKTL
jgi:hypothetical protein